MSNRRTFLKTSLAATAGVFALNLNTVHASEKTSLPAGLIYTKENPGKWAAKVGGHLPIVKVEGKTVTITTDHDMSDKHYIVRHTIVTPEGEVLAEKTFASSDEEAISVFELSGDYPLLYASSFCNKHDLWVAEFSL